MHMKKKGCRLGRMTVREYRERLGLTLNALARTTGLARATLERLEAGKGCSAKTALTLLRASHGLITLEDVVPGGAEEFPPGKAAAIPGGLE